MRPIAPLKIRIIGVVSQQSPTISDLNRIREHRRQLVAGRKFADSCVCPRRNQAGANLGHPDLHDDLQQSVRTLPVFLPGERHADAIHGARHDCRCQCQCESVMPL